MRIHRRQFLKYCVGSAAALGLPLTVLGKLEQALAAEAATLPKVIWLNGANCTGCTVSLANLFSESGPTDIADLLFNTIDLAFHPNLMGAAGDLAVQQIHDTAAGSFILAVDGGIPTAFDGHTCVLWSEDGREVTAMEAIEMLAPKAAAVLSIGTCASYGGIPSAGPNPTDVVSVNAFTGGGAINIPGCPTHPDWIVYTIAHLLAGQVPKLDERNRPEALFQEKIHKICPRKEKGEAKLFGEGDKCLKEIGCKGEKTFSDCPIRKWNNGTNWCIGAGAICIGCTEQGFPDKFSPFYKLEYEYKEYTKNEQTPTDPLIISAAFWETQEAQLVVTGKGPPGQIVTIYDHLSQIQLGAISVSSSGDWEYRRTGLTDIPQTVRAVSKNQEVTASVANIPSPEVAFTIKRAVWRQDKLKLVVVGFGSAGEIVDIYNGATGEKIGTKTIGTNEKWRLVQKNPEKVPCKVLAVCRGKELLKNVKNAPSDCV